MQTIQQNSAASRLAAKAQWQGDQVYRDTVVPFGVQRRDYLSCCAFWNSIEKFGVKSTAIKCLENGHKGFRLKLQSESGREYEVMVEGATAKLGLVRPRQPRSLLAEGAASSEGTWEKFASFIKEKEGK